MLLLRSYVLLPLILVIGPTQAQRIMGRLLPPLRAEHVVLYGTRGADHPAIDMAAVDANGRFAFPNLTRPAGFYQLGVNDSDRVDIVLDPVEDVVELEFQDSPLQRHIKVVQSSENQRMWAYKGYSRSTQAELGLIQDQRAVASPMDTGLLRSLDRQQARVMLRLPQLLDSLTAMAPEGVFAKAVQLDRALDAVTGEPPASIRQVFNFADPRTLRSSSYAKAMMLLLQGTDFSQPMALNRSCDSLLAAAAMDTACWSYAREHLLEIFSTYGPDDVAQYLVDRYVVGPDSRTPPSMAVLRIAADQLRMVNGAPAPDIDLVAPEGPDTTRLADLLPQHAFTVLFFYSSTCDHCHAQIPGLRQLVADVDPKKLQVVGIALDADLQEFRTSMVVQGINWPCFSELNGWGAKAAKAYNVKATPTLIVLDRQSKIRAKPTDHLELKAFLNANDR